MVVFATMGASASLTLSKSFELTTEDSGTLKVAVPSESRDWLAP